LELPIVKRSQSHPRHYAFDSDVTGFPGHDLGRENHITAVTVLPSVSQDGRKIGPLVDNFTGGVNGRKTA